MATYFEKDYWIDWKSFTEGFTGQPAFRFRHASTVSRDPRPLNEYTAEEFAELERQAAAKQETDAQRANRLLSEVASKYDPKSS